jgi:sarcosine oxidase subunit beta
MVGLAIPIRPQRGQIIVTEPLPLNKRWRYICDADYLTTAFNIEAAEKSKDQRMKLGVAGSYAQEDTGNWTIGSSRDFAGYNNQVTMETVSYLAKRLIQFMPKFKEINCIRTYAGFRPVCCLDGLPILSKVDNPSGFIIATGHAGEGVTLAPITGKLISELITENRTSMPIDAFSFSRFKGIKTESTS